MSAMLYCRISTPKWTIPSYDFRSINKRFGITPSYAYGRAEPLATLDLLTAAYKCLADEKVERSQKRAENAVHLVVGSFLGPEIYNILPLGVSTPLREAARACQLAPPGDWPLAAYKAIGRDDLAASAIDAPDMLINDGYRPIKDYVVRHFSVLTLYI
jgi:anaphase-promoting complex subunit 1